MKKKLLAILLTIITICATLFSASVSVSAASNVALVNQARQMLPFTVTIRLKQKLPLQFQ